jgi:hypothetical protein
MPQTSDTASERAKMASEMPSDDFRSEFSYLTERGFSRPECYRPGHVLSHFAVEAKTHLLFADTPSMATARMRLSENLLAEGWNPQRRLSDGDCLR